MSCFNPMVGRWDGKTFTENGLKKIKIEDHYVHDLYKNDPDAFLIPCGKCIGCKLDYSREWADRMMLEYLCTKKAIFITLTYNEESLSKLPILGLDPYTGQVFHAFRKRDYQLFLKSLREKVAEKDIKLRFFLAAEYGDEKLRNHYHLIIFGIDMNCLEKQFGDKFTYHGMNEWHQPHWSSAFLESFWKDTKDSKPKGYVQIADATEYTMNYVARYTIKKVIGDDRIESFGMMPEFCAMSRRPGIGSEYAKTHDIKEVSCVNIRNGKKIFWPKKVLEYAMSDEWNISVPCECNGQVEYYDISFRTPRKEYYDMMERRQVDSFLSIESMMKQTSLSYEEQLKVALTDKIKSFKMVKRIDPVV